MQLDNRLMGIGVGQEARKGSDDEEKAVKEIEEFNQENVKQKDYRMIEEENGWIQLDIRWKIYEIVETEDGMISGDEKWVFEIKSIFDEEIKEN